ncbi:hypothetical protein LOK49_LG01G03693 [Camellia lanceoleosa]|uniref:Uncharacterized protein n=1 Tax=Camellia lanceoleosa TaxID=1840588 RepID=A0ACC0IX16_9ERIC|nr:hypothetical protein LOK49_LG01G03693 [Camellia lanceoleosa]
MASNKGFGGRKDLIEAYVALQHIVSSMNYTCGVYIVVLHAALERFEATRKISRNPNPFKQQLDHLNSELETSSGTPCNQGGSGTTSKKRAREAEGIAKGLVDMAVEFGSFFKKTNTTMEEIAHRIGYAQDLSQARKLVNKELAKLRLNTNDRLKAATLIVKDAERVDLFFSLPKEEKMEWVFFTCGEILALPLMVYWSADEFDKIVCQVFPDVVSVDLAVDLAMPFSSGYAPLGQKQQNRDFLIAGNCHPIVEWAEEPEVNPEELAKTKIAFVRNLPADADENYLKKLFDALGKEPVITDPYETAVLSLPVAVKERLLRILRLGIATRFHIDIQSLTSLKELPESGAISILFMLLGPEENNKAEYLAALISRKQVGKLGLNQHALNLSMIRDVASKESELSCFSNIVHLPTADPLASRVGLTVARLLFSADNQHC